MSPALRVGICLVMAGLTACSGQSSRQSGPSHFQRSGNAYRDNLSLAQERRYRSSHDSVPDGPPPDFSKLPEPVPRVEPRSLYGNKSPYNVLGHTYTVLPTAHGYVERGTASYYGSKFHRYKTSTLEDYDMYDYSAAHKTLPLPSYVRVTNLQNGKSVVVRVNDRGPFKDDRLIDLSYIAAVKIGIWPSGTGQVEVRALDPGSIAAAPAVVQRPAVIPARPVSIPVAAATSSRGAVVAAPVAVGTAMLSTPGPQPAGKVPAPSPAVVDGIYLQVGAFGERTNADGVAARIRAAGIASVQVIPGLSAGRVVQRVRVGPLSDQAAVSTTSQRIMQLGLPRPQPAVN